MDRQAVGKQSELFFKEFRPPVRFLRGKSVAVAVDRAGTRVPEFPDILRGVAKLAVASKNGFDGGDCERIIVVVRLDPAEKYQQQHLVPTENRGSTLLLSPDTFPPPRQPVLGTERHTPLMAGSIPQRTLFSLS